MLDRTPDNFADWLGYEDMDALLADCKVTAGNVLEIPKAMALKFKEFTEWFVKDAGLIAGSYAPVLSASGMSVNGEFWKFQPVPSSSATPVGTVFPKPLTDGSEAKYYLGNSGYYVLIVGESTSSNTKADKQNVYMYSPTGSKVFDTRLNVTYDLCLGAYTNSFGESCVVVTWYYNSWRFPSVTGSTVAFPTFGDLGLSADGSSTFDASKDDTKNPPDITGEGAKPAVTVTDANAATIEELLRQILEKMESNTLATDIAVDGTQTGDNTGDKTDEDAKPYLPYIPQIFEKIKDLPGTLSNIWETIKGLPAAIAEKIGAFFTTLWGWLQKVLDAIVSIPAAVAEKVGELFKPDEALVTEITDTFKGKFGFISTLNSFVSDLFGMTAETEPPVIWVHFENAESKYGYDYGGKEKMLDLSWYQKYKANVDTLVSGFLWLGFLWLLFKRTAAIIQGGEMLAEYSHDFSQGRRDSNETKFQRYLRKD